MDRLAIAPRRPAVSISERLLVLLAWLVLVPLLVLDVVRVLVGDTAAGDLPMIVAMSPYLHLPAYGALGFAAGARRPALIAASMVVVAAHLVFTEPELGPLRQPASTARGDGLVVMTANLLHRPRHLDDFAAEVARRNPDLLLVQELIPEHAAELDRLGLLEAYPHHVVDPRGGSFGSAILSRVDLEDGAIVDVGGGPMTMARFRTAGGLVDIVNVHTLAPIPASAARVWAAQLAALERMAEASDAPMIMAGDFNASHQHRAFRSLAGNFTEAHHRAGRGLGPTWPANRAFPPLIRIDHVLVRGFDVVAVDNGPPSGSDHLPVIATLAD